MSWWESIEERLAELGEELPDPWSDVPEATPTLTDEQLAALDPLGDQPSPPRLDGLGLDDENRESTR